MSALLRGVLVTRKARIDIGLPSLVFRVWQYDNQSEDNGFSSRYRSGSCRLA